VRAIAVATPRVPAENGSSSNTPIGPFHRIVRASASVRANSSTDRGPMSSPIRSRGSSAAFTVSRLASAEISGAATTSSGSWISTPRSSAARSASRASSTRSRSTRLPPTSPPWATMNVKAMAPPTRMASTRSVSAEIVGSLSDTFAPPRTAT
jgi:hypothetical protein